MQQSYIPLEVIKQRVERRQREAAPVLRPLTSTVARLLDLEQERQRLYKQWVEEELRRARPAKIVLNMSGEAKRSTPTGPGAGRKASWRDQLKK